MAPKVKRIEGGLKSYVEDKIVEEVRRTRQKLAARFDYDIKAFVENAKSEQAASGRKRVPFSPRKPATRQNRKPAVAKA
ncbi:MAG: hypothetical protein ABL952_14215 [Pyrinomonadaceae bacterium]